MSLGVIKVRRDTARMIINLTTKEGITQPFHVNPKRIPELRVKYGLDFLVDNPEIEAITGPLPWS